MTAPRRAIVLSGGGARGAYEAGVLRYILEELVDDLGAPPRFDVICGTSVGAINSTWLAATVDRPDFCTQRLSYLWRRLEFEHVIKINYAALWRMVGDWVGADDMLRRFAQQSEATGHRGGLLDTSYLNALITEEIPFERLAVNLEQGLIDALTVSTTDIITGRTTVFVQTATGQLPVWTNDPRRTAISAPVDAQKVLASAAIPMLFPPVKIGSHWFCDGGVRQNTPLSPALRLHADRVLVVNLRSQIDLHGHPSIFDEPSDAHLDDYPTMGFLLGKLLNAALLDPLDYDLAVLERINAMLRCATEATHDVDFIDHLNAVVRKHRGQPYKIVEPLLIRPSHDLGRMASEFAASQPDEFWGSRVMASFARSATEHQGYRESDILSYILFDGGYTGDLLDLGFHDAMTRHDELLDFFQD